MESFQKISEHTEQKSFHISLIKWILIGFSGIMLLIIIWLYLMFLQNPQGKASPDQLGLPTLFIFFGLIFLYFIVPWDKLGLRLTKFGPVEFENYRKTQAAEYAEDLAEIEERLDGLEKQSRNEDLVSIMKEKMDEPQLEKALKDFFIQNSPFEYSTKQIKRWLIEKSDLEKSVNLTPAFIRRGLRKLVSEGFIKTTISKTGTTLFHYAE